MKEKQAPDRKAILASVIVAASKIAQRLSWSTRKVAPLMPLDADKIRELSDQDQESLDAFLLRFTSLIIAVQDSVGRFILEVEEEDLSSKSKKDQRLLLEKLGALNPDRGFGDLAELRDKISDRYPYDMARQADVLNDVFARAHDALVIFEQLKDFANRRHFDDRLDAESPAGPSGSTS